jgi:DNA polymerase I-like protein with 3'-5' exonuclease and polymerase domains
MGGTGVRATDQLEVIIQEVSRLRGYGVDLGFDLETTGTNPLTSKIVTIAFKPAGKRAAIFDVRQFTPDQLGQLGPVLEPLLDGFLTLVGHNLKFDLEFFLAQVGLAGHKVFDTMLAEQVIYGLGMSSSRKKAISFGLEDVATRYGVPVEKESRSWFIDLDQRPEWTEPLPQQQLEYIRQDVSVVHRIKAAQMEAIREYHLEETAVLEMRALFALVGVEVFGVQINRAGWKAVINHARMVMEDQEALLHLGNDAFEGLDVHILAARQDRYMAKWRPYEDWMRARDTYVANLKDYWEGHKEEEVRAYEHAFAEVQCQAQSSAPDGQVVFKNWSEYKKYHLEHWYETHEKMTRPAPLKSGVNFGSWMQVRDGFNAIGIPVKSVGADELAPYAKRHPLVPVYLRYMEARKLVTVYGDEKSNKKAKSFFEMLDASDRLRASYQQIGADTGRMSSYNPNFQQVPSDGLGAELRKNVIAEAGKVLVNADFSNIELRITAELSNDKFLLDAFASKQDLHAYTAKVMFNLDIPPEADPKEFTSSRKVILNGRELGLTYRKAAKTINYMLLYGAGVNKLSAMMEVEKKDAKALQTLYYDTFKSAITFLKSQQSRLDRAREAREDRVFAETRAGRRRWFDIPEKPIYPAATSGRMSVEEVDRWEEAMDQWKSELASIKRQLANTPIQGLSADITKTAAALWYEEVGYNPDMKLVAIIHDEFLVEATESHAQQAADTLRRVMYTAMKQHLHVVDLGEVEAVTSDHWVH